VWLVHQNDDSKVARWTAPQPICPIWQDPLHDLDRTGGEFARAYKATAEADFATYIDEVVQARMVVWGRSLDDTFGDETVTVDLRCQPGYLLGQSSGQGFPTSRTNR
jgi:hypothetical protein